MINRDTRAALACSLRIQGPDLQTTRLFGGFPSAAVEPGTYDRVKGRWVARDDGGSVAQQHRAMSSGALATPHRGGKPDPVHQCKGGCGGTFICEGCNRMVGWCRGGSDDLGAEHCDDCWSERRELLAFLADGPCSLAKLERSFGSSGWRQYVASMLEELQDEHFVVVDARERYRLAPRGREALS